jgi:hypothetical protein
MPHNGRTAFERCSMLVIVAALICLTARAQREESFEGFMSGIRANAVEGTVLYQRKDGKFPLETGLKLEEGDSIRTSNNSYAELLLQPGNYFRIGSQTDCQIFSEPYDKMRLKVTEGVINLEILSREMSNFFFTPDMINELIRVITPNAEILIARPGVFRINVTSGRTQLIVRKGEAVISGRRVKEKRAAIAANGAVTISEIDSKVEDRFDTWARDRAATMVKANKLLKKTSPWAKIRDQDAEMSVKLSDDEERAVPGRIISAKPGTVNFVENGVELGAPEKWEQLTEKSEPESGDTLRTNENSFVELVLFPDMYLRLDHLSEVLLDQLSNDAISLKVLRGSAIVDIARFDRKQMPQITIGGPTTSVVISDKGNYRIDARGGSDSISVRDGKVVFAERNVGDCRIIAGGTVSDCDKKPVDNFDFWSQYRGEGGLYNGRYVVSTATYLARLRLLRFRNTGFWFQQPGEMSYTFVPFTSRLYRSPYGGNYSPVLSSRPFLNRAHVNNGSPSQIREPKLVKPQP